MLPGLALPQLGAVRSIDYAAAIAAITDKTIYCRADTATGADGASLTTTNWDNEAIATPNVSGAAVYKTNILNGKRGILAENYTDAGNTDRPISDVIGGTVDFTILAVERRNGFQGGNTGDGRYVNNKVVGASDYWGLLFEGDSRDFWMYTYGPVIGYAYANLGATFTDNVPYVITVQSDASGNVRCTFNGAVKSVSGTLSNPAYQAGIVLINSNNAGSSRTDYGFEYIVSSSRQSDALVDAAAAALMQKWSIS